jgi:predicted acylesterase/phospholipase RssA
MSEARPVVTLAMALCDEFRAIHGEDVPSATDHSTDAVERSYRLAAAAKEQAALCLSGRGIRSAAFSLGVLQALARKGLLARFHYLSTVSGGGYAGGWLSAVSHDSGGDIEAVQKLLARPEAPPQLSNLRAYTNYLTPQSGLASADTWTGIIPDLNSARPQLIEITYTIQLARRL